MSEITGVGRYVDVERRSVTLSIGGFDCRVMDIATMIQAKKALGRAKDLQAATELEAIMDKLNKS